MNLTRRIVRPDYEGEPRAIWIDPNYIATDQRLKLERLLPKKMTAVQRQEFMESVAGVVQWAELICHKETNGEKKTQIAEVAGKARALLQSIANVKTSSWPVLRAYGNEFLIDGICPSLVSEQCESAILAGEMLPIFWDVVQDIETVFKYVEEQLKTDRQDRPAVDNAKQLIGEVAKAYFNATGKWPPYGKEAWFVYFAEFLGDMAGLKIGRDTVQGAVKDQKSRA